MLVVSFNLILAKAIETSSEEIGSADSSVITANDVHSQSPTKIIKRNSRYSANVRSLYRS